MRKCDRCGKNLTGSYTYLVNRDGEKYCCLNCENKRNYATTYRVHFYKKMKGYDTPQYRSDLSYFRDDRVIDD